MGGMRVRVFAAALEWAIFLVLFPFLLLHPRVRQGIRRRLGLYDGDIVRRPGPRVWLHGASAGDVLGLVPIVRELKALRPDARVLVSAITDSGASMAEQRLIASGLADAVTFLPYDLPGPCRRAIAALRPDVLVLEYTELWPQLIRAASRAGVRLAMTNGRIAPENLGRYRLLFALAGNLLEQFDVLMMRAEDEAERALQLGAPRDRVHVTGNTKFDALAVSVPEAEDEELRAALGLRGERLWVCGSTHEGEEGPLLDAYAALRREFPDLRLVLAPRYVERSSRVLGAARERGLPSRLRSEPGGGEAVVVLDTIGELVRVYQLATLVFVGGSFTRRGGQNILEPAACGKPVLFGPRMENFQDSVQVLVGRGGLQVRDPIALLQLMRDLLARPDEIAKLGELAREAVSSVRGASARDARLIAEPLLMARRGLTVFVGPRRALLAKRAVERGADVLVLDDGLQHHGLARDLDVVVADASNPFGNGRLLPRGPMREPVSALSRVENGLLWLTRCDLPRDPRVAQLPAWAVLESEYAASADLRGKRVFLFAGIARPASFEATVRALGAEMAGARWFRDHHRYGAYELSALRRDAGGALLVTTEKDLVRIEQREGIAAVPVEVRIRAGEDRLDAALGAIL